MFWLAIGANTARAGDGDLIINDQNLAISDDTIVLDVANAADGPVTLSALPSEEADDDCDIDVRPRRPIPEDAIRPVTLELSDSCESDEGFAFELTADDEQGATVATAEAEAAAASPDDAISWANLREALAFGAIASAVAVAVAWSKECRTTSDPGGTTALRAARWQSMS